MKKLITLAVFVMLAVLAATAAAATAGTVIYAYKTDTAPNPDEIDESWGEPAIHIDTKTPNTEIVTYWKNNELRKNVVPEDNDFDVYFLYDNKNIYFALRSSDDHINGAQDLYRGDGVHLWLQIFDTMENPNGPNGMHLGATHAERNKLEESCLFYVCLGSDNKSSDWGCASKYLEEKPKIVVKDNEIQCFITIPFDFYGLKGNKVHGMEFGITVMRISSVSTLDEGFAGWFTWGKAYEEYDSLPSVNTLILWDPANGMPDGMAPAESEDTTPPATETDPVTEPNLDGVSGWAKEEVEKGIAEGLVPTELQQNYTTPVTRGQVAQMFINLLEKATGKTVDEIMAEKGVAINENAFTDTTDKAVLAANALGIINGTGNGKFSPDGTLKRAQIAAIINRVAKVMGVGTEGYTHEFTDITDNYKWADSELGWPVYAGIINGVGGGKFNPGGDLTTEQAILITYRALGALR